MSPVRTRFAPSPTGSLHLGNVRVALFNWLFARHHGGSFVLRIEDTDLNRTEEGSEEAIMEDLEWLGLRWDEGPGSGGPLGPYRQSERGPHYQRVGNDLVARGLAYPCFCSGEDLDGEKEVTPDGLEVHRYSGRCRNLSPQAREAREAEGRASVLRFAVPEDGTVEILDEIYGSIEFSCNDIGDFIILRDDGRPTYNFAVVVDDLLMEITHVIRGAGHLSNTPKQALLFDALDEERPRFAHLPMVLSPDGGKLSKREGSSGVTDLRQAGFHPDGVLNYLSLLGWSSPTGEEVLSRQELVAQISLERVRTSDTIFDPEKLRWLSGQHLGRLDLRDLADSAARFIDADRFPLSGKELEWAVEALRPRLLTLGEVNRHLEEFFFPSAEAVWQMAREHIQAHPDEREVIRAVKAALVAEEQWVPEALAKSIRLTGKAL
ncbi:glutamate--tRNA ligase, partial [Gemmatimonadota bacterium]